jgi:ring-1,2-phenylacetyl-CoA epoxidase subunit PaaC
MALELHKYTLLLADNVLVLGQRLAEWCGHGPVLEIDMALTNISLDLFGQARAYLQYAAEVEGAGRTEDDLAFLRDVGAFRNVLLVEQPNGDFAQTIVRQFLFDAFHHLFLEGLSHSKDQQLAAIAEKSLKEVAYHLRFSSDWVLRLGDGTEESRQKMQAAVDLLWPYAAELCTPVAIETAMAEAGFAPDVAELKGSYYEKIGNIIKEASLELPASTWPQTGGKSGHHSEHLGHLLAEMQWMQRAYPNMNW